MWLNIKRSNWLVAPNGSKFWITIPLAYSLFIQILTGFPRPDTLKNAEVHAFFIQLSEDIFDYPFWIQDLSHFPLFFLFAWLWGWFIRRKKQNSTTLYWTILVSISFALINELTQFYIPQRFPSIGDIIMNLSGVSLAMAFHCICLKILYPVDR